MTEEHGTRPAARNNTGWRAGRRWVTGQATVDPKKRHRLNHDRQAAERS